MSDSSNLTLESIVALYFVVQVKIGLRVLTRPVADELPTVYRTLGENYNERVLPSIIHETLKAVVAQYNASQLITQREVLSKFLFNLWYSLDPEINVHNEKEKFTLNNNRGIMSFSIS